MSDETYTPTARIGDNIYNSFFTECFNAQWKANETRDDSWTNAIRTCVQRQIDAFKIVSRFHENKPSFEIPAPNSGDDEEEEDEDDE